ncbi:MAG TPA: hypothetical protein VGN36_01200, partial [Sphingorhabdus sp.]|nr:hypothetical protein [Sphingorhabdus sp.]
MPPQYAIKVAALYRFVAFAEPERLQLLIQAECNARGIKGTILLAHEGINGTIAGKPEAIDAMVDYLRALPGCAELDVKYSHADE